MRRFSLHKRGSRYYVQFWNPSTKKYTTARSTGVTNKNAAVGVVMRWLDKGIPSNVSARNLTETLNADTLFTLLHRVDLSDREAERIVEILTERGLLRQTDEDDEPLIQFLTTFWDYDESEYVREKLAYGQSIGKRHCYDMGLQIQNHWREFFDEAKTLKTTTRDDLRRFSIYLADK